MRGTCSCLGGKTPDCPGATACTTALFGCHPPFGIYWNTLGTSAMQYMRVMAGDTPSTMTDQTAPHEGILCKPYIFHPLQYDYLLSVLTSNSIADVFLLPPDPHYGCCAGTALSGQRCTYPGREGSNWGADCPARARPGCQLLHCRAPHPPWRRVLGNAGCNGGPWSVGDRARHRVGPQKALTGGAAPCDMCRFCLFRLGAVWSDSEKHACVHFRRPSP